MRLIYFTKDDFELFHADITPLDYEFFRSHFGAFKRMLSEQSRTFLKIFLDTFEKFVWQHGVMKDFALKADEIDVCVAEIMHYIRCQFVDGKASKARALVVNCVVATQHRHNVSMLDKAPYSQNPFYMKESRETFRELFGLPDNKRAYLKVVCGLPVYVKFAGAVAQLLRRWLVAAELYSTNAMRVAEYESNIVIQTPKATPTYEHRLQRLLEERWKSRDDASQVSGKSDDTATGASSSSSSATDEEKRKKKRKKKKVASSGEDQNPPLLLSSSSDAKPHPQEKPIDTTTPTPTQPSDEGVEPVAEDDAKPHPQEKPVSLTESCATTPTATSITEPSDDGVELVAEEEVGAVARDDDGTAKRKLHTCASCSVEEHEAKTFKRCQRCRGKMNPKYYCSRECQVKDWKTHRLDHKD